MSRPRDDSEEDEDFGDLGNHSAPLPHILLKEGYLQKKSPKGIIKMWQSRYFRLYTDVMEYYKTKKDPKPCGCIPIMAITAVEIPEKHKSKGDRFDVVLGDRETGRVFALVATSKEECSKWVEVLNKLLKDRDEALKEQQKNAGASTTASVLVAAASVAQEGKFWKDAQRVADLNAKVQKETIRAAREGRGDGELDGASAEDEKKAKRAASAPMAGKLAKMLGDSKPGDVPTPTIRSKPKEPKALEIRLNMKISSAHSVGPIGAVFRAFDKKSTGGAIPGLGLQPYLIHMIQKSDPDYQDTLRIFNVYKTLDSPFVLRQLCTGETEDASFAVYQPGFDSEHSLVAILEAHRRFPEDVVQYFAAQLVTAIEYLHSQNPARTVACLSPETVYITGDGNISIFDVLLPLPGDVMPEERFLPEYTLPEDKETLASDWWRLGVLLYDMSVGIPPFRSRAEDPQVKAQEIVKQIKQFQPEKLKFPPYVQGELRALIQALLQPDPAKRLGGKDDAEEVKKHPFFQTEDFDWDLFDGERGPGADKAPLWLRKTVLEPNAESFKNLRPHPVRFAHQVSVELLTARNTPSTTKSFYCQMTLGDLCKKSTARDGPQPDWKDTYTFEITSAALEEEELKIELFCGSNSVGTISMPVADIKAQQGASVDVWQSVIASDGTPTGVEIHVVYKWEKARTEIPLPKYLPLSFQKKFFDQFGSPKDGTALPQKEKSALRKPWVEEEKKVTAEEKKSKAASKARDERESEDEKASGSDSEDEKAKRSPKAEAKKTAPNKPARDSDESDSEAEDKPTPKAAAKKAAASSDDSDDEEKPKAPAKKAASSDDSESEDEKPKSAPKPAAPKVGFGAAISAAAAQKAAKKPAAKSESDSDDDGPPPSVPPVPPVPPVPEEGRQKRPLAAAKKPVSKKADSSDDEDEEDDGSDSDSPKKPAPKAVARKAAASSDDSDSDDEKPKAPAKAAPKAAAQKGSDSDSEEEQKPKKIPVGAAKMPGLSATLAAQAAAKRAAASPVPPVSKSDDSDSEADDKAPKKPTPKAAAKKAAASSDDSDSDAEDKPKAPAKAAAKVPAKKAASSDDSDSEDEKPKAPAPKAAARASVKKAVSSDDSDNEAPPPVPPVPPVPKSASKKADSSDDDSDSDDDKAPKKPAPKTVARKAAASSDDSDSDDDEKPRAPSKAAPKAVAKAPAKKAASSSDDSDSDDDSPKKPAPKAAARASTKKAADSDDDLPPPPAPPSDDEAKPQRKSKASKKDSSDSDSDTDTKKKASVKKPASKKSVVDSDDEEEEEMRRMAAEAAKAKKTPSSPAPSAGAGSKCSQCSCTSFKQNPFKKNMCANCNHSH